MFNNNLGLKRKIKLVIIYTAITISLGYMFTGFMIDGWYQAIDLTSRLFYHEAKTVTITTPKHETVEAMIKETFGKDAKVALAVSHAENGTRQCDRIHVNNDKSVDIGIFQLNSVHFAKGYSVKDFANCKKNIEIAYQIFQKQGWSPWVAYKNNSYKKYL